MKNHRHGDVDIVIVAGVPKGAEMIYDGKKFTLAEGEATGHHHTVTTEERVEIWEFGGQRFMVVGDTGATMTHQEHKEQHIAPGVYRVDIETERDPFLQSIRKVRD